MKKGFTLLEILVAVTILAIISSLALRALQLVIVARERIEIASDRVQEIQTALNLLHQDFKNIVDRPIRLGPETSEASFVFTPTAPSQVTFTRGGLTNPGGLASRSALERVAYRFKDHQLERLSWQSLDRGPNDIQKKRIILRNIETLEWRFMGDDDQFYTTWPTNGFTFPTAIEARVVSEKGKEFRVLIPLDNINLNSEKS